MKTLLQLGYELRAAELPATVRAAVEVRDWVRLDSEIRRETSPGGVLFETMRDYTEFTEIEFIIAIRSSREYPDEDGIWHDDGSRVMAFSLSLTLAPEVVQGGVLEIRPRFDERASVARIPTPPFGTLIVFQTGVGGYEHKIGAVTQGERVIIAGWCTA